MDVLGRPEYLVNLLEEIEAMDEGLFPPRQVRQEKEKIVGTVAGWPRKLFSLALMYQREAERFCVEANYSEDAGIGTSALKAAAKKDILMNLFWSCVREQLSCWELQNNIGIRSEWLIVELPAGQDILNLFGINR